MKKFFLLVLVVTVLAVLVACDNNKKTVKDAPTESLTFVLEPNPNYIGSYSITRVNNGQEWLEWGEWTPLEALIGRQIVCFGYFGGSGTFRARSDYHWIQIEYDGRKTKCLELVKKTKQANEGLVISLNAKYLRIYHETLRDPFKSTFSQ